jgi:hypothetical protein
MSFLQHDYSFLICCFDYSCPNIQILSITDWYLFFCWLKINHDSHEFILEFGTVANIYDHPQRCCYHLTSDLLRRNSAAFANLTVFVISTLKNAERMVEATDLC